MMFNISRVFSRANKHLQLSTISTSSRVLSKTQDKGVGVQEQSTPGGPSPDEIAQSDSAYDPSKPDPTSSAEGIQQETGKPFAEGTTAANPKGSPVASKLGDKNDKQSGNTLSGGRPHLDSTKKSN